MQVPKIKTRNQSCVNYRGVFIFSTRRRMAKYESFKPETAIRRMFGFKCFKRNIKPSMKDKTQEVPISKQVSFTHVFFAHAQIRRDDFRVNCCHPVD